MPGIIESGDIIVWAHRVGPDGGDRSVQGQESARVEWQVYADRPNASVYDLARSPRIPPRGEELWDYIPPPALTNPVTGYPDESTDSTSYSYVRGGLLSSNLAVANHQWRQSPQDPFLWTLTVVYEGNTDPTAQPADVNSEIVEFQEHTNYDVYGRLIANIVGDPFTGGMPRDDNEKVIKIVRAVPFDLWDMDMGEAYHNTLNALPFPLSRQVRWVTVEGEDVQVPVICPPGTVRLKKITETEVVRTPGIHPAGRNYYWRVSAELALDKKIITLPTGARAARMHRWVVANTGHNEVRYDATLQIWKRQAISNRFAQTAVTEHFLDINGRAIPPAPPLPEFHDLVAGGGPPDTQVWGNPDFYAVAQGGTLTVLAPGVLANDAAGTSCQVDVPPPGPKTAAFTLNADGSLVFAPNPAVVNEWITFTYKVKKGAAVSAPVRVFVLVAPVPVWTAFERYPYADWTPLAPVLSNW